MTSTRHCKEAFRQAAKVLAAVRCLDADATAAGVILKLNSSQMARDGLEAAALRFAESDSDHVTGHALSRAAAAAARQSPYRVWWTCTASLSQPITLARDEIWVNAQDIREVAVDLPGERELVAA